MSQLLHILPQIPPHVEKRLHAGPEVASGRPTFALYTLGCKVNQYDSHQIARMLVARGFKRVEFREAADLYVIDTCTITAEADKKSRKAASRAVRNNPHAVVAVTGCAATKDAEQFRRVVPGALVLSNAEKFELPERALLKLESAETWAANYERWRNETGSEPVPSPTRERAVVKIQDGCDHRCSYCIIPRVRGASVLKSTAQIMSEARAFVREGARELVITGVSMGDWNDGMKPSPSRGRNEELCRLIRAVATVEGLERVRVSSLDPADVDDEFLRTIASTEKVCPQIHLALQSGSAGVLRRMRRRYNPEMFLKWARRWREFRPDGGLTTDVIVGFPGETEAEWRETMELCRAAKFSAIHAFPYSPREGTFAGAHLDELGGLVAPAVQARRVDELISLGAELSAEFAWQFLGTEQELFVEGIFEDEVEGLTPQYVRARAAKPAGGAVKGDLVRFVAGGWEDGCLYGVQ